MMVLMNPLTANGLQERIMLTIKEITNKLIIVEKLILSLSGHVFLI
jgi:hypothetical protein